MAKNHILPRYLLRATLCLCLLFGSRLLSGPDKTPSVTEQQADADKALPAHGPRPPTADHDDRREVLQRVYTAEIGVQETTGRNDGPRVAEYLRYCGLDAGHPWCAAFVSWCFGQAGYEQPRNPWSPALLPAKRVIWRQGDRKPPMKGTRIKEQGQSLPAVSRDKEQTGSKDTTFPLVPHVIIPRQGDVFGIYYVNLRRIGHVGFVDSWDGTWCITVEGNTRPDRMPGTEAHRANPIRAGPATEGVYRKRRPVRTIHAVADWIDQ